MQFAVKNNRYFLSTILILLKLKLVFKRHIVVTNSMIYLVIQVLEYSNYSEFLFLNSSFGSRYLDVVFVHNLCLFIFRISLAFSDQKSSDSCLNFGSRFFFQIRIRFSLVAPAGRTASTAAAASLHGFSIIRWTLQK